MVKRISFYTAFGQFLSMIEREMAAEENQVPTDRPVLEEPLSDYQKAINSDLQVRWATEAVIKGTAALRRTLSCPMVAFVVPSLPVSPAPTSIESRKINEATERMMDFWSVKVDVDCSLFEKLDGMFTAPASVMSEVPSIYGKFEGVFEQSARSMSSPVETVVTELYDADDEATLIPSSPILKRSAMIGALQQKIEAQKAVIAAQQRVIQQFIDLNDVCKKLDKVSKI